MTVIKSEMSEKIQKTKEDYAEGMQKINNMQQNIRNKVIYDINFNKIKISGENLNRKCRKKLTKQS